MAGENAPFAADPRQSRGRKYLEETHPFRNPFQRDRDRIVHSQAFRHLEAKTQVLLSENGGRYRTRLTHTIEVAAIARTIARALGANEDLTETVALAHDLGHPAFGHNGERTLDRLLKPFKLGFNHNEQALRIVDQLECKYPGYPGLNLCWETRSSLVKHRTAVVLKFDGERLAPNPLIEGQIADVADDLTYLSHDLDDGLHNNLIREEQLNGLVLWDEAREAALAAGLTSDSPAYLPNIIRWFIDRAVADVVKHSKSLLNQFQPADSLAIQEAPQRLVAMSPLFKEEALSLKRFLFKNMYFHPTVEKLNERGARYLNVLFKYYRKHPHNMPKFFADRLAIDPTERVIADYLGSQTDPAIITLVGKIDPHALD